MRAYRKVDDHYELKVEGGRMALLGVGAALVLVLVFLLGVLVGKNLWGGRRPAPVPLAEAPREVLNPAREAGDRRPDLTFYEDLKRPDRPAEEPVPRPMAPLPMADTPVPGRVEAAPSTGQAPAAREETAAAVPTPVPERKAPPTVEAKPQPRLPQPHFTVQVGSFRDRSAADELARQVSRHGVSARVVTAAVGDRTWHRVQVGRFETRAEAEALYRDTLRPKGIQGFVTTR